MPEWIKYFISSPVALCNDELKTKKGKNKQPCISGISGMFPTSSSVFLKREHEINLKNINIF